MSQCIFHTQPSWGHWQWQEPGPETYMNQYSCSQWNRSLVMLCQYSSFLTQGSFWYTPTDEGTKRERAIKGGMSRHNGYVLFLFFRHHIQTSRQRYSSPSTHLWPKDEKLYLILVLLCSFHLSWGVGEILRAFVELVLHGVNGMATGIQETGNYSMQVSFKMFKFIYEKSDQRSGVSKRQIKSMLIFRHWFY